MKRTLVRSMGVAAIAAAAVALAGSAKAAPISFAVDPSSSVTIGISTVLLGGGSASTGASGAADVDLTAGVLTPGANSLSFADINGTWVGGGLFANVIILGAGGSLSGAAVNEGPPGVYDLAGWTLTLDSGTVTIPALGATPVFDFSTGPVALTLGSTLSAIDTSGPLATWDIPVSALVTFSTLSQVVTVTVAGALNLTEVPEPGTIMLIGAGVAGLATFGRKRSA